MIVGVPREIKEEENRVALTPSGVGALVAHGHGVVVEHGAGTGSRLPDARYRDAGAELAEARAVWTRADLVLKVKEPEPSEYELLRPDLVLFTYLHLAANPALTRILIERRVRALAYETLQPDDGSLPLLAPMSEVAGRLAVQAGAWCLQAQSAGRGMLLSGASGVRPAKVVILGAGIAGTNACQVAVGVGADVSILDIDPAKLRYVHDILGGHVTTVMSNRANLEEEVVAADLVIGSVLIPGARAPRLLPRALVGAMRPGAALVDLSSDQGDGASVIRHAARCVFGNAMTSRMESAPARSITSRSNPMAMPPCGGAPNDRASSRKPNRACASVSDMPSSANTRCWTSGWWIRMLPPPSSVPLSTRS